MLRRRAVIDMASTLNSRARFVTYAADLSTGYSFPRLRITAARKAFGCGSFRTGDFSRTLSRDRDAIPLFLDFEDDPDCRCPHDFLAAEIFLHIFDCDLIARPQFWKCSWHQQIDWNLGQLRRFRQDQFHCGIIQGCIIRT
jgi:hypothetical protein